MLTVYRIHMNVDKYQWFGPVEADFFKNFHFDGESYEDRWTPPEVYVYKPKKKAPDFWAFGAAAGFAISKELYHQLSFIDPVGEMLPLTFDGREMLFLNVTNVIECLNKKASVYDPELPSYVDKYVFLPKRINQSIFKIPQTAITEMFAVEGIAGPDDQFKTVVEKLGLKGIIFDKVWSESD